jgi:arylsulfatase
MSRPNILWIMTDEQRPDTLGCYDQPWAKTPHLDRLADRGVRFETAVCQSPIC